MSMKIEDIEGIGPKYAAILRQSGVNTAEKLLSMGATRDGRKNLAEKTGINESNLLKWVNLCDLCRIKGISTQYSELLEAAGVDTVKELRTRRADNLADKIQEINAQKRLVRQTPGLNLIVSWVEQAKSMKPVVTH